MKLITFTALSLFALTNCQHNIDANGKEQELELYDKRSGVEAALAGNMVDFWLTKGDQSVLLQQQASLTFGTKTNRHAQMLSKLRKGEWLRRFDLSASSNNALNPISTRM